MIKSTTFWNGGDTLDRLKSLTSNRSGKSVTHVISGISFQSLVFVCAVQFAIGILLALASFYLPTREALVFSVLFMMIGLLVLAVGLYYRHHQVFFATNWLTITDARMTFRNGEVWEYENPFSIKFGTDFVPNGEGGESIGWLIIFENAFGESQTYQFLWQEDFLIIRQALEQSVKSHGLTKVSLEVMEKTPRLSTPQLT